MPSFSIYIDYDGVGARTTESQVHRELSSGLSVPVGFKNGTNGGVSIALDAIKAAASSHHFLSVTKQGLSAIVETRGNDACHVILRGGETGPNYSSQHVQAVIAQLEQKKLPPRLMIDCSHGNSQKQHKRQLDVIQNICEQIVENPNGHGIFGVMVESHLVEGRQDLMQQGGKEGLEYGKSVTDACIGWEDTELVLRQLSDAVQQMRTKKKL